MSRDGKQSSSVVGILLRWPRSVSPRRGHILGGSWNQLPLRISASIDFAALIAAFSQVCPRTYLGNGVVRLSLHQTVRRSLRRSAQRSGNELYVGDAHT